MIKLLTLKALLPQLSDLKNGSALIECILRVLAPNKLTLKAVVYKLSVFVNAAVQNK